MSAGRAAWAIALVMLATSSRAWSTEAAATRRDYQVGTAVGQAFAALEQKEWATLEGLTNGIDDPVAAKLLFWLKVIRNEGTASFDQISAFVDANPDWPYGAAMRRRAEEALPADMPPVRLVAWFNGRAPSSPYGQFRLAAALLALGDTARAAAITRQAWRTGGFTPEVEAAFRESLSSLLTPADHVARLDTLLWQGRHTAARRLYDVVGGDYIALAEARIQLRGQGGDVEAAVAAVPPALSRDPGLIYERVRWRRKNGLESDARELLSANPAVGGRPDLWWIERNSLAREALQAGHVSEAYRLVRDHGSIDAGDYADAEWLAGWIALRFLREPIVARAHFLSMFNAVQYPISRARGAYWAARTFEATGDQEQAAAWYDTAASYPLTFYGRLARDKIAAPAQLDLPRDPEPSAEEATAFRNNDLVRAIRLLGANNQQSAVRPFVERLSKLDPAPGWQILTAALAAEAGGAGLGVATAKRAIQDGIPALEQAYPLMALPNPPQGLPRRADPALLLAMIRQESSFDLNAMSPSGARGLMQLMPRTARHVAGTLEMPYSLSRLTADPDYNLQLGQAYVSSLLDAFEGSPVLAFAAYNAGPSRVRQWLSEFGDPRDGAVDAIDWIEMIPFDETRNYVQRAIENLWVYRARLGGKTIALATDLGR